MRQIVRAALLSIVLAGPAGAQGRVGPPPGPAFALFRPAPTPPAERHEGFLHTSAPDYGWEGIVIGGAIGAALLGTFGYALCRDEYSRGQCFLGALGVAPVGFVVGGFVGGLVGIGIPKGHSEK